jgi:hypothetical protein
MIVADRMGGVQHMLQRDLLRIGVDPKVWGGGAEA